MKTINKTFISLAIASLAMTGFNSCSDFLEEHSQDLAKVESWEDLDEVLLGDGYMQPSAMSSSGRIGDDIDCLHFLADEIKQNISPYGDTHNYCKGMFSYYTWQQDMGYDEQLKYAGGDDKYWNALYKHINVCNMVLYMIDRQGGDTDYDTANKARIKGEAYFLRAAYYFLLANMYAQPYEPSKASSTPGVPVKISEFVEDSEFMRETLDKTYERILSDLNEAEILLDGAPVKTPHRATYPAVLLLKSRVYLYMQDWKNAAKYAQLTLERNKKLLDLHSKINGDDCVYLSSPETIFSMGGYAIANGFSEFIDMFGYTNEPALFLSDDIIALYGDDDIRTTLYIGMSEQYAYGPVFLKRNGQLSKQSTVSDVSSTFLLRTPEAYLILAEASAFDGNEPLAVTTMETFMNTRYETKVSVDLTGHDLVDLIRDERAREFLLEGHRWFDLRRYAVCEPYAWSKVIEHGHIYYVDISEYDHTDYYRLEEYDQGYTLPIPRSVREFQPSIGNNPRPARKAVRTESAGL